MFDIAENFFHFKYSIFNENKVLKKPIMFKKEHLKEHLS